MIIGLKKGSLKRNVFFMFLGNGIFAFSQWIQISILAKFADIKELGMFTLGLSLVAPLFMFSGLQLRTILITDAEKKVKFSNYFSLRLFTVLLSLLIVLISVFIFFENEVKYIILLIAALKAVEGMSELFNSKHQQSENMEYMAISLMLKGVFASLAIFIGVYYFKSLIFGLLLNVFFSFLILLVYDYFTYKQKYREEYLQIRFDSKILKKIIYKGLPLGIVLLIISLNSNVPKYFLEYFLGTKIQAIFSTITYILVIGVFVIDALGQSFVPRLSNYFYNSQLTEFTSLAKKFICFNFFLGLILWVISVFFGKQILEFLFNLEIAAYSEFFAKLMFLGIFIYVSSTLGYILSAMHIFKEQPYINSFVFLLNLLGCYIFIKNYGFDGVLYSLGFAYVVQIAITIFVIQKKIKEKKNDKNKGYSCIGKI